MPFTICFVIVATLSNGLAGTLSGVLPVPSLEAWGISHDRVLNGEIFRLISGTFLSHDFSMFLRQIAFALGVIGYYEWKCGTLWAVAMFFSLDILGTVLVLAVVVPLLAHASHTSEVVLQTYDVGMSAGGFGLIGAIIWLQNRRFLWLGLGAVMLLIKTYFSFDPIADSAHLLCLGLGFLAQGGLAKLSSYPPKQTS